MHLPVTSAWQSARMPERRMPARQDPTSRAASRRETAGPDMDGQGTDSRGTDSRGTANQGMASQDGANQAGWAAGPVRHALEGLAGTVTMARLLAESGRQIDLAGLDREAGTLCTAVALLPVGEARLLRPLLEALCRDVDALHASLRPG
jgi:hypothetical protein